MSIVIRTATPQDEAAVTALLNASYPELMGPAYDPDTLAAALPLMTQANPSLMASGTYYLAQTETGKIVGCGGWTRERPGIKDIEPGVAHIRHFGTDPRYTGQGIGRAIFDRCQDDAKSAGISRFEVYSSLNAEGFYTALGFQQRHQFDLHMTPTVKIPSVLMDRAI